MNEKHTSELMENFQYRLLQRKRKLYDDIDERNENEIDEQNQVFNTINRDEIYRIDIILKSLKKL